MIRHLLKKEQDEEFLREMEAIMSAMCKERDPGVKCWKKGSFHECSVVEDGKEPLEFNFTQTRWWFFKFKNNVFRID